MLLSEFIEHLEELKSIYGDNEVKFLGGLTPRSDCSSELIPLLRALYKEGGYAICIHEPPSVGDSKLENALWRLVVEWL